MCRKMRNGLASCISRFFVISKTFLLKPTNAIKRSSLVITVLLVLFIMNGCTQMVTKSNIVPNYVDKQIPVEEVKIEEGKEIKTISYKTQRVQEGTKSEDVQVREINWIATFVLFMLIIPVIL